MFEIADPGGQSEAVVVRPLAGRDSGFESRRGHGCLSLVNVMYWYMSCRFAHSLLASCEQTGMTYTIAVCAVKNS